MSDAIEITDEVGKGRHVHAGQMAVQRAGQIKSRLQAGFLTWVLMHKQQNRFHRRLLFRFGKFNLGRLIGCRYAEYYGGEQRSIVSVAEIGRDPKYSPQWAAWRG
ncbi:MAG: hypothetical protein PSX79_11800 [bacterium]|nr:hypothetical protein [bacterium]